MKYVYKAIIGTFCIREQSLFSHPFYFSITTCLSHVRLFKPNTYSFLFFLHIILKIVTTKGFVRKEKCLFNDQSIEGKYKKNRKGQLNYKIGKIYSKLIN